VGRKRVLITRDRVRFEHQPLARGQEYNLPDWFAGRLVRGEMAVEVEGRGSPLPDDFPGRSSLLAAGITTIESVGKVMDFDELKGIGQATERRIVAYLEQMNQEGGSDG